MFRGDTKSLRLIEIPAFRTERRRSRKSERSHLPTWDNVLNIEYEKWDESVDGLATIIFTDNGEKALSECLEVIRNHLD